MNEKLPDDPALASFSAGSRIAGYRLEDRVGAGGMAVVFRAVDERLGRPVALKVMSAELAADEAFRQRFIRESRAAAAVDDPHLIPIYEAGEADGVLFIAMRYVAGGDVHSLVQRDGPLPAPRAASITSPIASALDAAHAAGLVHRDVKPANILLDAGQRRPDHVYLTDFGISRRTQSLAKLTGTGQFLGTVDYAAPEQIEGAAADGRADQYALACTVFELLSGEPPFRRDEASAVMWAKMTEPPPLLTSRRSGLPPAVDGVLAKALARRPQDRYGTCQDFADALRESLGLTPYDAGAPTILDGSHRPAAARHQAGVTGTGQLAAAQDEQHQPTKDATVLPLRGPVDDRSQQAGRAGLQRSVSAHGDLSRREEIPVYGAVMSAAPWGAAVVTGGVVAVFDLGLHLIGAGYSLAALSGSLAMGTVAFFVVATAGALWRARPSPAVRWARSNPWRFAVMPAITCAVVALVLSVATGGDIHGVLSGLWHGGVVYGLTAIAGTVSKSRKNAF